MKQNDGDISALVSGTLDSELFQTLSEPIRIELLKVLAVKGPLDITTVASGFPQDRSVISRHLKMMESAGILVVVKEGRKSLYRVNGAAFLEKLEEMVTAVRRLISLRCPDCE